jgi:hypothetical protein
MLCTLSIFSFISWDIFKCPGVENTGIVRDQKAEQINTFEIFRRWELH